MLCVFRVVPPTRASVFTWRKVGSAPRVTLSRQPSDPATRVTLLPEASCDLSCKRSLRFIKKRMNSWRAQGDSGRRVTRVPGATFSHVNRALKSTGCARVSMTNHKYYNFLESDWSINPPIRALIGHLHVIGHLQSEIVILMINW